MTEHSSITRAQQAIFAARCFPCTSESECLALIEFAEDARCSLMATYLGGEIGQCPVDWRVSWLEARPLLRELDTILDGGLKSKDMEGLLPRRLRFSRMNRAKYFADRKAKKEQANQTRWMDIGSSDVAIKYKQSGFDVRYIGTTWQYASRKEV